MIFLFASLFISKLCFREEGEFPECPEDYTKLTSINEINNYANDSIILELYNDMKTTAEITELNESIQDLEIVGHHSFIQIDVTNHHSFERFAITNTTFLFKSKTFNEPITIKLFSAFNCDYELSDYTLNVEKYVGDLEGIAAFKDVKVSDELHIDVTVPYATKVELTNKACKTHISGFRQNAKVTAESNQVVIDFGQNVVTRIINWNSEVHIQHEETDAILTYKQENEDTAEKIYIHLGQKAKFNLETASVQLNKYSTVIVDGDAEMQIHSDKKQVNLEIHKDLTIRGPCSQFEIVLISGGSIAFAIEQDKESDQNEQINEIEYLQITGSGYITSNIGLDLRVNVFVIVDCDQTKPVTSEYISVVGYPDFLIEDSNIHIGKMALSNAQKFTFKTSLTKKDGLIIDNPSSYANLLTVYLDYDGKSPKDIENLINETFYLITMPNHFIPQQTFLVSGLTAESIGYPSIFSPVVENGEVGKFGFKIKANPDSVYVKACIAAENDACSYGKTISEVSELQKLISADTKVIDLQVSKSVPIHIGFLSHHIDFRISSELKDRPEIDLTISQNFIEFTDKLTLKNVKLNLKLEENPLEFHIPKIVFEDKPVVDLGSATICDKTIIQYPIDSYPLSFNHNKIRLSLNSDATIQITAQGWNFVEAKKQISFDVPLEIHCDNLLNLTIDADDGSVITKPLGLYGDDVSVQFKVRGNHPPSAVVKSFVSHCLILDDVDYLPIHLEADLNNVVYDGLYTARFIEQDLDDSHIVIGTKSTSAAEIEVLNMDDKSSITCYPIYALTIKSLLLHDDSDATFTNVVMLEDDILLTKTAKITLVDTNPSTTTFKIMADLNNADHIFLDASHNIIKPKDIILYANIDQSYLEKLPIVIKLMKGTKFMHSVKPQITTSVPLFSTRTSIYEENDIILAKIDGVPVASPAATEIPTPPPSESTPQPTPTTTTSTTTPDQSKISELLKGRKAIIVLGVLVLLCLVLIIIIVWCKKFKKPSKNFDDKVDASMLVDDVHIDGGEDFDVLNL